MRHILITGAGRGLGLEITRQYLNRGDFIFACIRNIEKSIQLKILQDKYTNQISIINMDVADPISIEKSYNEIQKQTNKLDLLINNAGINKTESAQILGQLDLKQMLAMFQVNSIAPILIAQRFIELLKAGDTPRIINISSERGSITAQKKGGNYGYTASKAALNMFMRTLAFDVMSFGIICIVIDPGWVQTDMGGYKAPLTPEQSVQGLLKVIDNLTEKKTGQFLTWDGNELPW